MFSLLKAIDILEKSGKAAAVAGSMLPPQNGRPLSSAPSTKTTSTSSPLAPSHISAAAPAAVLPPSGFLSPQHLQSPTGIQQLLSPSYSTMWQAAAAAAAAAVAQHSAAAAAAVGQNGSVGDQLEATTTFSQANGTLNRVSSLGFDRLDTGRKRPLQEEATSSTDLLPSPSQQQRSAVNLSPTAAAADIKAKRRTLTLDFSSKESARKTLQTPEIVKFLQLRTPELEKFITQGSATATSTPTQYLFPKDVTSPQRQYAQGFIDALNALHRLNGSTPPVTLLSPTSQASKLPQPSAAPAVAADSTTGDVLPSNGAGCSNSSSCSAGRSGSRAAGSAGGNGSPVTCSLTNAPLVAPNSEKVIEVVSSIVSAGGALPAAAVDPVGTVVQAPAARPASAAQLAQQVAPHDLLSTAVNMMQFSSQHSKFPDFLSGGGGTSANSPTAGGSSTGYSAYGTQPSLVLKQEPWPDAHHQQQHPQSAAAAAGLNYGGEFATGRPTVLVAPQHQQQQHASCSMQGRDALRRQLSATGAGGSTRCSSKMSDYNIAVTSTGDEMSNASAASTPMLDPFAQSALVQPMDPHVQERAKLERKRERNRLAATRCRKRKLDLIDTLKQTVDEKTEKLEHLTAIEQSLGKSVSHMRQWIESHNRAGCDMAQIASQMQSSSAAGSSTAASSSSTAAVLS